MTWLALEPGSAHIDRHTSSARRRQPRGPCQRKRGRCQPDPPANGDSMRGSAEIPVAPLALMHVIPAGCCHGGQVNGEQRNSSNWPRTYFLRKQCLCAKQGSKGFKQRLCPQPTKDSWLQNGAYLNFEDSLVVCVRGNGIGASQVLWPDGDSQPGPLCIDLCHAGPRLRQAVHLCPAQRLDALELLVEVLLQRADLAELLGAHSRSSLCARP